MFGSFISFFSNLFSKKQKPEIKKNIVNTDQQEKYIAVGDIHGCYTQVKELLSICQNQYPAHKLIFLGDYIDRGHEAEKIIKHIRNMDAIFLMGNHEDMLIKSMRAVSDSKKKKLLTEKKISWDSYEWIALKLKLFFETENYFFSHAGLNPEKSLKQQTKRDYLWTVYDGSYTKVTDKIVVHGHTHRKIINLKENHIAIDTDCSVGGYLSGFVVPENKLIQSKTKSENYGHF